MGLLLQKLQSLKMIIVWLIILKMIEKRNPEFWMHENVLLICYYYADGTKLRYSLVFELKFIPKNAFLFSSSMNKTDLNKQAYCMHIQKDLFRSNVAYASRLICYYLCAISQKTIIRFIFVVSGDRLELFSKF